MGEAAIGLTTIQEIERAIDALTPELLDQLYQWLDRRHPAPARLPGKPAGETAAPREGRTGADLIAALQASPYRKIEIEPERYRLRFPVRDVHL